MSEFSTKGYKACPIYDEKTSYQFLTHVIKLSYMGHRRFLSRKHVYINWKKVFNSSREFELAPQPLTETEILEIVSKLEFRLAKVKISDINKKGKRRSNVKIVKIPKSCWKKKFMFFELEYWQHLLLRHNLDVMHIEKNICDSIIGTLLNIPGKNKDSISARMDLVDMGVWTELAPRVGEKRTYLPPACFTLKKEEKYQLCQSLFNVKVPEGYSSNIRTLVDMNNLKLVGLKSHDCHTLMQHLLLIVIQSVFPKNIRYAITRLCLLFNGICSKVVDVSNLDEL